MPNRLKTSIDKMRIRFTPDFSQCLPQAIRSGPK
jgi:hypothetical protein